MFENVRERAKGAQEVRFLACNALSCWDDAKISYFEKLECTLPLSKAQIDGDYQEGPTPYESCVIGNVYFPMCTLPARY